MEFVFVCQDILPDRNRVRYNRVLFLCNNYRVHVLVKGYICREAVSNAISVNRFPKFFPRIFFIMWAFLIIISLRSRKKLIVYTTYEPINLLVGYISQKLGAKWIADILDDPEKPLMIARSLSNDLSNKLIILYRKMEYLIPKAILKKADFYVTLIKPELIEKYNVSEERIYSLTNGVNVDIDYPEPLNNSNELFTLVYVGPMERIRIKNIPLVLEKLFNRIGAFNIYLIGPDVKGGIDWLKTRLLKLSPEVRINITGRLPHEEVLNIIANSDISLCVYPNEADLNPAYPIKIFESMIMGKPIVATRLRGTSEIIDHEVNGYLVEPGNVEQMVEIIVSLKENPALRKKVGEEAKKRAYKFDWKIIHKRLGKELNNFIEKSW